MSGRALVIGATAAAVILAGGYAALGGGRYDPPDTADPCEQRAMRPLEDTEAVVERLALAALDGAACELDVSREEVTLAVFSEDERDRFVRKHDVDDDDLEDAVRAGLLRAVDEAERNGTIDDTVARLIRAAARFVPLDSVIDALQIE